MRMHISYAASGELASYETVVDQSQGMVQGSVYSVKITLRGGLMELVVDGAVQASVTIAGSIESGTSVPVYACGGNGVCANAEIRRLSYGALPSPPPPPPPSCAICAPNGCHSLGW